MRFDPDLVNTAQLRDGIDVVFDHSPRLLPPSATDFAFSNRRDELAQWIHGQLGNRYFPPQEETVAVSKARQGIRPVAVWDLVSSVLYATLVNRLAPQLPAVVRGRDKWKEFQRLPLAERGSYVISADLASCYALIDHRLLADELQLRTGDFQTVTALVALLAAVGERTYGLPQQSLPSDIIAEAFLNRLERALHRRGLRLWRYNDDFRLVCKDWSDVVRSLEILDEECRRLGLILNDSKTRPWRRATYEAHLNAAEELREEIAAEAEIDLTWTEPGLYDMRVVKPHPDDVEILASARILERWQDVAGRGHVDDARKAEHVAILELMPAALDRLSPEPGVLPRTLRTTLAMLRYEQTMTPYVCRYLASRPEKHQVLTSLDHFLREGRYLTGWQSWWLQQSLANDPAFRRGKNGPLRIQWLRDSLNEFQRNPVLTAHTLMTLARHEEVDERELLAVYDRASPVVRLPIVRALAHLRPSPEVRSAVGGDSELHQWIFESVENDVRHTP